MIHSKLTEVLSHDCFEHACSSTRILEARSEVDLTLFPFDRRTRGKWENVGYFGRTAAERKKDKVFILLQGRWEGKWLNHDVKQLFGDVRGHLQRPSGTWRQLCDAFHRHNNNKVWWFNLTYYHLCISRFPGFKLSFTIFNFDSL